MPLEQAIEYALSTEEPDPPAPSRKPRKKPQAHEPSDSLTRRQREVATLIGRGLTNRLIAEELHLSEHTVIAHVREIRKKLGARSRARIATWITEEQRR